VIWELNYNKWFKYLHQNRFQDGFKNHLGKEYK